MIAAQRGHPSWEELAAFDLGQLSDDSWAAAAEHLITCEACSSLIDTVPKDSFVRKLRSALPADETESGSEQGEPSHDDATSDVPSGLIGHPRYRILEPLGAGGMGTVFKAEHILMGRLVAVKVLHQNLRDRKAAIARLVREVKALARLSHPNLVAAFDAEHCGDSLYVVMEYVEGETLDRIIRRCGTLPFSLACNWVGQATLGLQYACEHGLVHRDLKPSNLVVTPQGQVKILDFGLARLLDENEADSAQTPDGSIVGTPAYTAPEQALTPKTADSRADLYSLGCTWYELLTGQPPFPGATTLQQLLAHQDQSPRPVTQCRSDVPREVDAVFARLLAKDPAERFQTPGDFLQALKDLGQEPSQSLTSRPAQRSRLLLVLVGVIIAFLVLLGVGLWRTGLDSAGGPSANPEKTPAEGEKPAADSLGKFRGIWVGDVATGFRVEMRITSKNDKVEVTADYFNKKGQLAGNFVGVDTAIKNGVLTFSQKFEKKPVGTWRNGKLHTLEILNDNVLKFSWKGGGTEIFSRVSR